MTKKSFYNKYFFILFSQKGIAQLSTVLTIGSALILAINYAALSWLTQQQNNRKANSHSDFHRLNRQIYSMISNAQSCMYALSSLTNTDLGSINNLATGKTFPNPVLDTGNTPLFTLKVSERNFCSNALSGIPIQIRTPMTNTNTDTINTNTQQIQLTDPRWEDNYQSCDNITSFDPNTLSQFGGLRIVKLALTTSTPSSSNNFTPNYLTPYALNYSDLKQYQTNLPYVKNFYLFPTYPGNSVLVSIYTMRLEIRAIENRNINQIQNYVNQNTPPFSIDNLPYDFISNIEIAILADVGLYGKYLPTPTPSSSRPIVNVYGCSAARLISPASTTLNASLSDLFTINTSPSNTNQLIRIGPEKPTDSPKVLANSSYPLQNQTGYAITKQGNPLSTTQTLCAPFQMPNLFPTTPSDEVIANAANQSFNGTSLSTLAQPGSSSNANLYASMRIPDYTSRNCLYPFEIIRNRFMVECDMPTSMTVGLSQVFWPTEGILVVVNGQDRNVLSNQRFRAINFKCQKEEKTGKYFLHAFQ